MTVSLHPEADKELIAGAVFYAENASRKVAESFLEEFDHAVSLIAEHPGLGTVWRGETRRFPMRRFPYSIVYYPKGDELRVVALAHQRRKPGFWAGRS